MMRVNLFRPVHVKTLTSQKRRALLTARKLLQEKAIAIENDIRGLLRNFGLKVGIVGSRQIRGSDPRAPRGHVRSGGIMNPSACRPADSFARSSAALHRKFCDRQGRCDLQAVDDHSRRWPRRRAGFHRTIDIPARFRNSKAVGPVLGLTPVLNQSGESNRVGRVSLCGDGMMRTLLYEAAQVMLTVVKKWSWLKAWAMNVAKATRPAKSHCRPRTPAGSDHASHMERRHRVPLETENRQR